MDASKIVSEQAEPFAAVIESAGKTYEKDIAEGIVIKSEARGVQADGAGVDYNRFFERFYREDTSHNSKKGGFGIGLSIAQEICNKLGAKIQALYNKQTKEITFSVTFR